MTKRRFLLVPAVFLFFAMLLGTVYCIFPVQKETAGGGRQTFPGRRSTQPAGKPAYLEGEVLVKFNFRVAAAGVGLLAAKLAVDEIHEFRILSQLRHSAYFLLRSGSRSTDVLLAEMLANPDVEAASPNYRRSWQRLPNDPKFSKLWGMKKIGAADAWDKNIGSPDVVLAV